MVLLDGLYAKGPVFERCRQNRLQYMIVLKDGALPTVLQEFESLAELEPQQRRTMTWGGPQPTVSLGQRYRVRVRTQR